MTTEPATPSTRSLRPIEGALAVRSIVPWPGRLRLPVAPRAWPGFPDDPGRQASPRVERVLRLPNRRVATEVLRPARAGRDGYWPKRNRAGVSGGRHEA